MRAACVISCSGRLNLGSSLSIFAPGSLARAGWKKSQISPRGPGNDRAELLVHSLIHDHIFKNAGTSFSWAREQALEIVIDSIEASKKIG